MASGNFLEFLRQKLHTYQQGEKTCQALFPFLFSEKNNVFAEISDGYRIKKITYGECEATIQRLSPTLSRALAFAKKGSFVGVYMSNSVAFIQIFWSILQCGYKPLLLNSRLQDGILENTLTCYQVSTVISDSKAFPIPTLFSAELLQQAEQDGNAENAPPFTPDWENEMAFMSSGTSERIKLCVYTGEKFYTQICDSVGVMAKCAKLRQHYKGELKQLALLPFYHIFGFIAVYLWFSFFSRTFVFLKDMQPQTLVNTVKRHKVTHIFAVPLVWETMHKAALQKIRARGERTYAKFEKTLAFVNQSGGIGSLVAKSAFKKIRVSLFGESIRFMISGGSHIKGDTLRFFNGIGYRFANGFGMTEVGITSLDISNSRKRRNKGSIGAPFENTQYCIDSQGELLIKTKTPTKELVSKDETRMLGGNEWFSSRDMAREEKGQYYIEGRKDDLIVCENGENLNPVLLERSLIIDGANAICLFQDEQNRPTLLVSVQNCYTGEMLERLQKTTNVALKKAHLHDVVKRVVFTSDSLLEKTDFKISRKKIAQRLHEGRYLLLESERAETAFSLVLSALEEKVRACFAEALKKTPEEIGVNEDFFLALGGTSLDYFLLVDLLKRKFGKDLPLSDGKTATTVKEICEYIKTH